MTDQNMRQNADETDGSRIGIFISHRMEDQEIARKLEVKLQGELSKNKVEVHVCSETQGEKDWRDWIEKRILESQILIFLYTVEHEEAWRWCMYEIGMFNGLRIGDGNRSLVFLKNPHIKELPDPLGNTTYYNANKEGIQDFLEGLLFDGKHTPNGYKIINVQDRDTSYDKKFNYALEEINYAFKRSRLSIDYYTYRITIELKLKHSKDRKYRIEQSTIIGDSKTTDILQIPSNELKWEDLRRHFKAMGQMKWIQELEEITEQVADNQFVDRVLHPIAIEKYGRKDAYLPVVSSIEKMYPIEEDGKHEPTKISVIFIPQGLSQKGLLETQQTLIPFSKVKCILDPTNSPHIKQFADVEDAIQVVEMNQQCLNLYNLSESEFSSGNNQWTGLNLIERLKELNLVDKENIKKLIKDQTRVIDELLLKSYPKSEAIIPLQFNNRHPYFANQCFLPVIASSQFEDKSNERQVAHLLVAYVKDFWPADHEENPFNIEGTT